MSQQISLLKITDSSLSFDQKIHRAFDLDPGAGWPDKFGQDLFNWISSHSHPRIKTLSLFSGAGGLDIGFHDSGFEIETMVEIEERFVETLRANHGDGKYFPNDLTIDSIDVRKFRPSPNRKVDFIIGGPPCQTFSAAGRRAAGVKGTTDDRGILFKEYVRLIKHFSPIGFLFENVYGITGAENGKSFEKIKKAFQDAGYQIFHRILDSADYGVPQHRERLFIVGTKNKGEYYFPRPTHGPDSPGECPHYSAGKAVRGVKFENSEKKMFVNGRYGSLLNEIPPGLNYSFYTEKMGHPNPIFAWRSKFSDFLYKADPKLPVRTLKAQGGQYTGPFHWENRPFSIGELKRLQTFPDNYSIIGGKQLATHQIGNSVPPQIARVLAMSILQQLFGKKLPFDLPTLSPSQSLGFRTRKRQRRNIYQFKADAALSNLEIPSTKPINNVGSYSAILSNGFELEKVAEKVGTINVAVNLKKNEWVIFVSSPGEKLKSAFEISILPAKGVLWNLKTERVVLKGDAFSKEKYVACWKAFEKELIENNFKADIVQLCGYYQYVPAIKCNLNYSSKATSEFNQVEKRVLKSIVDGIGVGKIMPSNYFSDLWGASNKNVQRCALFLRSIGYEIRNKNTNPQLPRDHLLIPYSFPTLNPQSVQLRKSLG